uniref:Uncharacterized protein ycf20 n=1 Tax=Polysiphonia sp. TaxID=1967842 RepID=A0A1Z1MTL9_9FLOR|nr:hypothetical protein [Polysiphonia sp.]
MLFETSILSFILGFFIANIISTVPAQTGDWNIMSGSIIVTFNELINKFIYKIKNIDNLVTIRLINNIKVGIIYGLFVDAFKLGS